MPTDGLALTIDADAEPADLRPLARLLLQLAERQRSAAEPPAESQPADASLREARGD